jgi:hypothetical protein
MEIMKTNVGDWVRFGLYQEIGEDQHCRVSVIIDDSTKMVTIL